MKQVIAAVSLVATASVGMAQTPPAAQVYGVLDAGVTRVTGLRGGTQSSVVSGIMDGSRLGFKGNEDLGGGYRTLFTMEARVEADTGSVSNRPASGSQLPDRLSSATLLGLPAQLQPVVSNVAAGIGSTVGVNLAGNFWDRQIYVGLVTPVGAVLAGRMYTPAYELASAFDTTGTQSSLASGQIASVPSSVDIRASNALAYRIQQGPISGVFMYALGEGSRTTGRLLGVNAMYKTDAFSVGAAYNTRRNELAQKSLTSFVLGATVAVGPGTVVASFINVKDDNPTGLSSIAAGVAPALVGQGLSAPVAAATAGAVQNAFVQGLKQDARLMHVGYRMTTGPHTIYVAYSTFNDRRPNNADVASYGGVYSYALSKRTDLNFVLTHFDNKNLAQAAPGQAGYLGGVTASAGVDSTVVAAGIRHRF